MGRVLWPELGARPALFPALSLTVGAALAEATDLPTGLFLGGAASLWGVAWLGRHRTGAHLLLLTGFLLLGCGLARLHARTSVPAGMALGEVTLEGEVERAERGPSGTRVRLAVTKVPPLGEARFRVALFSPADVSLYPGQRVRVVAKLRPDEGPANPGEPDFTAAWRARGQRFRGSFRPDGWVALEAPGRFALWRERMVRDLQAGLHRFAPSPEAAALYLTLAAGERAQLGETLEESFARSGLAHVLSVSGLHVAALALALLWLLRILLVRLWPGARRYDARRLAAPLALPLVWGYVVFTGSQAPALRSAVMSSAALGALVLARRSDGLNGVCLGLLLLGVWDPPGLRDLSLILSFVSVASLLVLGPALREALPWQPSPEPPSEQSPLRRWGHTAREAALGSLCASAAVTVATLPWVATTFGRVSVAGLVSNVLCLPLGGVLTLLSAGGAAVHAVSPPLAVPFLWAGGWLCEGLVALAAGFSRLPGAALAVPALSGSLRLLYALGLCGWATLQGRARWVGLATPVAWALCLGAHTAGAHRPGLEVTFLSVGQGDAVVLSSSGHHALVDGGGAPAARLGQRHVLPYLRHRGIDRLELAVLSHPHPDHALGLTEVLPVVPTERLWLAAGTTDGDLSRQVVQAAGSAQVMEVERGTPGFQLGEAWVEVLGPPEDRELLEGVNDRSVVLRVSHGEVSFLLTGDIEGAAEESLAWERATVVKAPHHGSKTSSSQRFVDQVHPRHVVFCVGSQNRFGFPHPDVETRYRAAGARCHRTDVSGAVRFRSNGRDVEVSPFRAPTQPPEGTPLALSVQDLQLER